MASEDIIGKLWIGEGGPTYLRERNYPSEANQVQFLRVYSEITGKYYSLGVNLTTGEFEVTNDGVDSISQLNSLEGLVVYDDDFVFYDGKPVSYTT